MGIGALHRYSLSAPDRAVESKLEAVLRGVKLRSRRGGAQTPHTALLVVIVGTALLTR